MGNFNGVLNHNEVMSAIFNMIISQEIFTDNIAGTSLVEDAKVDGTLFGDQKLYYSHDVLTSSEWGNDSEASDLLELNRLEDISVQSIVLDQFRQIRLTLDNYMSKRGFTDKGGFEAMNSSLLSALNDTKKVYEGTTYNVFIGTEETTIGSQSQEIDGTNGQTIAEGLANIFSELTDFTKDYNDYGYLRKYDENAIKVVFNSKFINKIKNIDLPVIFDNAGLKATFAKKVLNYKYFGALNEEATTGDGSTVRSAVEQVIGTTHYFAGELIESDEEAPAGKSYTVDENIICKILIKYPVYMSGFSVQTTFFNPRSLTDNYYLTFGHNSLEHFKNYPYITVRKETNEDDNE